jgi:hypothetical protein
MGSACRCTTFHSPSSDRKIVVTLTTIGLTSSLNLGLAALYLHCVGKLRSYVLRYVLEAGGLAISVVRCGTFQGLSDLIPSTCGRAEGVSEGYILSPGVDPFITLGTPFHDLI